MSGIITDRLVICAMSFQKNNTRKITVSQLRYLELPCTWLVDGTLHTSKYSSLNHLTHCENKVAVVE